MKRIHTTSRTETDAVVGLLPDKKISRPAAGTRATPFNPQTFLAKVGNGKTTLQASKEQLIFSQGDAADAVFYVRAGRVKLTVLSQHGKEAVVGILEHGSFFGEGCLVGQLTCMATATALDASTIVRIEKAAMIRVLHDESTFSELFTAYLLSRNVRIQADLVDHLFNSAEKRLARILLLLARYGKEGIPEPVIPKISQDTLADMVGTTRSRVSFFLNKFRKLGFIHYKGRMEVHSSLLSIVLHD
ncbi:MAG TPA: Crp/Fnr family transcriptional regulator [Nitrospiraceae bacterium]|nr:Crp/Fnr family transcriptional regulator [Nitrospiraceae bacterium]